MRLDEYASPKVRKSFPTLEARFREKHGNKFDYSKMIIDRMNIKTTIICPIHGEFQQTPGAHLAGKGCNKCAREESGRLRSLSKGTFIERSRIIHQDKYNYSKILDIKNTSSKVTIICPVHGEFIQSVTSHLSGSGCSKCGDLNVSLKKTTSFNDFQIEALKIHGTKYSYSDLDWVNMTTKINIICPTHGIFSQVPSSHVTGVGCPKCSDDFKRHNSSIFIEKAKQVHGEKFDYSQVVYIQNKKKVDIICSIHGVFSQRCDTHLAGHGCPHCAKTIPPTERHENTPTYFYVIKYKGLYKVGVSLEGARQRYRWDVDNIDDVDILTEIIFDGYGKAYMFEQFLIAKYFKYRYFGVHIFKNTRNTEVFTDNIYEMYLKECADE